ncbi:MAG TPA: serine/threonine-protein phosphatase [Planctomycetaceae bacterium]|nr:serine/threonine-protein phosphatase [Planctomycetaceae bacterium]
MSENPERWKHCLEYAALSDVGLRRSNNQDSMVVVTASGQQAWERRGHLFVVADGMGAHAAGELASRMAVEAIPLVYQKLSGNNPAHALHQAMTAANAQIFERGQATDDFRGMGTTASALVLLPQGALVAHCGDSRVYRLREQKFEQLTFDHSLVWEMSAAGRIPENEVPDYVPKNIITRSLGPSEHAEIDLEGPFPLQTGDTFLLCSDGLSGPVRDEEMGTIVECLSPDDAVRALVDLANLRGGPDNITVIVARVTGPQQAGGGRSGEPVGLAEATRPIPALLWSFLGASCLVALGAAAMGHWAVGLLGLIGAMVFGLFLLLRRFGADAPNEVWAAQPLGKGPHRTYRCRPDAEFVDRLSHTVGQLRDAATNEDWEIDWHHFNQIQAEADSATFNARYPAAVRLYCRALSFMMSELRAQQSSDG